MVLRKNINENMFFGVIYLMSERIKVEKDTVSLENLPKSAKICQNPPKSAKVCQSLPKSAKIHGI